MFSDGRWERFTGTHWVKLSEGEAQRLVLEIFTERWGSESLSKKFLEVMRLLRARLAISREKQHPDDPKPIINCKNGELWLQPEGGVRLQPHNPESRQHYCLDIVYDPEATCPLYDSVIREIFSRSSDSGALGCHWDEAVGTLIHPKREEPCILVCWGAGGDAKTLLVRLLMALLDSSVIASMPVESLTGSRFVRGDFIGKRLFVDMDMTAGVTLPDGMLKLLSEETLTTAERKNREAVTFTMRATPLLVGNNVPHLADRSQGFKRRLQVIPFSRSFTAEERDNGLFRRIVATDMPGVLNRALAGLKRVIERGWKFDIPPDVAAAIEAWWLKATEQGRSMPERRGRAEKAGRSLNMPVSTSAMPELLASPLSDAHRSTSARRRLRR